MALVNLFEIGTYSLIVGCYTQTVRCAVLDERECHRGLYAFV